MTSYRRHYHYRMTFAKGIHIRTVELLHTSLPLAEEKARLMRAGKGGKVLIDSSWTLAGAMRRDDNNWNVGKPPTSDWQQLDLPPAKQRTLSRLAGIIDNLQSNADMLTRMLGNADVIEPTLADDACSQCGDPLSDFDIQQQHGTCVGCRCC